MSNENNESSIMNCFVKNLSGKSFAITFTEQTTVEKLIKEYIDKAGGQFSNVYFVAGTKNFSIEDKDKKLIDIGVTRDMSIYCIARLVGG